jgi:hypothetical protein
VGDVPVLPGCRVVVILRTRIRAAVAKGYALASPDLQSFAVDDSDQLTAYSDVGVAAAFDSGHRRDLAFGLRSSEPDRRVQEPSIKLLNEDSTFQRC